MDDFPSSLDIEEYEGFDQIKVNIYYVVDDHELNISCLRILSKDWDVNIITEDWQGEKLVYYLEDGLLDNVELYDFETRSKIGSKLDDLGIVNQEQLLESIDNILVEIGAEALGYIPNVTDYKDDTDFPRVVVSFPNKKLETITIYLLLIEDVWVPIAVTGDDPVYGFRAYYTSELYDQEVDLYDYETGELIP